MLNKLHNLVVTHKNKIQQVRVQTIQKMVQKIRKLKQLIEKKPLLTTNLNVKLRKTTQIMDELKKLKRLELMKRVLLQQQNPIIIITNGIAAAEEIAIAMLRVNNIMQELISQFKVALEINDESSEWQEELLRVSKRRQKITRTEQKRRKRLEIKARKLLSLGKTQEEVDAIINIKNNTKKQKSKKIATQDKSATTLKDVVVTESMEINGELIKNSIKKIKLSEQRQLNDKNQENELNDKLSNKRKKTDKNKQENQKKKPLQTTKIKSKLDELKTEHLNNSFQLSLDADDVANANSNEITKSTTETEVEFVVDPFFLTETGENYMSTAVTTHTQNDDKEEMQTNPFKAKKLKDLHKNNSKKSKIQFNVTTENNKRKLSVENTNPTTNETAMTTKTKTKEDSTQQQLHPSWLAKQKLKSTIKAFEGKKITFGDDNDD